MFEEDVPPPPQAQSVAPEDVQRKPVDRPARNKPDRLGLALSGGGFRASFFHLGVLARLADTGVLSQVEVISTVSGGSVIGALYYLYLRNELQSRPDEELDRDAYVDIVRRVTSHFEQAVEHNLRVRTLTSLRRNMRMLYQDYSRSDRMAELYNRYFYAPVLGDTPDSLPHIAIRPIDAPDIDPLRPDPETDRSGNDGRGAKVPVLVINATTLNTGHRYELTTSFFGEEPNRNHVDKNLLLSATPYLVGGEPNPGIPVKYRSLPLSIAVAASTAVPGIFHPLPFTDLYTTVAGHEWLVPQLVDGGVHENQGVEGLLARDCTDVIVSDAAGQLLDSDYMGDSILGVLFRTNNVLMARVREEEFEALKSREDFERLYNARVPQNAINDLLRGKKDGPTSPVRSIYLHLKHGMEQHAVKACANSLDSPALPSPPKPWTVDPEIQIALANIRTDLDAFSEVESRSLMALGYLVAEHRGFDELAAAPADRFLSPADQSRTPEPFLDFEPYLRGDKRASRYVERLQVGGKVLGKVLYTYRTVQVLLAMVGLGLVGLAVYLFANYWDTEIPDMGEPTYGGLAVVLLAVTGYATVLILAGRVRSTPQSQFWRSLPRDVFMKSIIALIAWVVTNGHLVLANRLFLRHGRAHKITGLKKQHPAPAPKLERGWLLRFDAVITAVLVGLAIGAMYWLFAVNVWTGLLAAAAALGLAFAHARLPDGSVAEWDWQTRTAGWFLIGCGLVLAGYGLVAALLHVDPVDKAPDVAAWPVWLQWVLVATGGALVTRGIIARFVHAPNRGDSSDSSDAAGAAKSPAAPSAA